MRFLAAAVAVLLLAGCSDPTEPGAATDPDLTSGLDAEPSPDAAAPEPVLSRVAVELDGDLGTWFYACETQTTGTCQRQQATAADAHLLLEQPGATLVAAELKLTWSADSPATDTLGLGLMRMGDNSTLVQNVEGTSPLSINVTGLDLLLDEENLVHVYVYNVRGFVHNPPVVGYASVDQGFSLRGGLTMRT